MGTDMQCNAGSEMVRVAPPSMVRMGMLRVTYAKVSGSSRARFRAKIRPPPSIETLHAWRWSKPAEPCRVANDGSTHVVSGRVEGSELVSVMNESRLVPFQIFGLVGVNTPLVCLHLARSVRVRGEVSSCGVDAMRVHTNFWSSPRWGVTSWTSFTFFTTPYADVTL